MFITVSKTELTKRIKWGTDGQLKANYYAISYLKDGQFPSELKEYYKIKLNTEAVKEIDKVYYCTKENKFLVEAEGRKYTLKKYDVLLTGEEREAETEMLINRSSLKKLIQDGFIYGKCGGNDQPEKEYYLITSKKFDKNDFTTETGFFQISTDGNHKFVLYPGHRYNIKFKNID